MFVNKPDGSIAPLLCHYLLFVLCIKYKSRHILGVCLIPLDQCSNHHSVSNIYFAFLLGNVQLMKVRKNSAFYSKVLV